MNKEAILCPLCGAPLDFSSRPIYFDNDSDGKIVTKCCRVAVGPVDDPSQD